jgi:sporulation protein YlmC with PRC-barrel domain
MYDLLDIQVLFKTKPTKDILIKSLNINNIEYEDKDSFIKINNNIITYIGDKIILIIPNTVYTILNINSKDVCSQIISKLNE